MEQYYNSAQEKMEQTVVALKKDLGTVSTGRANPSLLDTIRVDCYGSLMPLNQVSNITVPESTTLSIQVWDKSMVSVIEKAIINANLGFNPMSDGQIVRINIPKLSEERRKELCKLVRKYGEDKKISIRNARRDSIDEIKKRKDEFSEDDVHKFTDRVQKLTDDHTSKVDELVSVKEKDIITI